MTPAFRRGSVAACGRAVGVVWAVRGAELVLLPIGRAEPPGRRADVPLSEISDMQTAGVMGRELVIQCDAAECAPIEGQRLAGELTAELLRQVEAAVARWTREAALAQIWGGHSRHRAMARRMTGVRA